MSSPRTTAEQRPKASRANYESSQGDGQDKRHPCLLRPAPNFAASWNVAPTDPLPVVRYDAKDHQRSLEVMRWGLIPFWAKDEKIGFSTIKRPG
jgi:putative SOS response-associated peptidase YedK